MDGGSGALVDDAVSGARPPKRGGLVLSRLSFRSKLLLVLFVPFLALVVVAAAGLSGRFTDLRAQEQYGELVAPFRSLDRLSAAIENESVTTSWYIAAKGAPASELTRAQDQTDVAVHDFRASEQGFASGGVTDTTVRRLATVNRGLDRLQDVRAEAARVVEAPGVARDALLGVD